MSRQPINVLVFPYFINEEDKIEYAIFKRSDGNWWQGISGGVEGNENIIDAAKRECWEESRIDRNSSYIKLDAVSSVPRNIFNYNWDTDVYVVKEYSFGVKVNSKELILSDEHEEYGWFSYDECISLLKWDSNKTALWELNRRLYEKIEL